MTKKKDPEDLLPKGRPSGYQPEFCEKVIALGKEGASKADIADALDISLRTLYNWTELHPDFMQAMEKAEVKAEVWWAAQGKKALWTPGFNTAAWSRAMAARFPKTWRENKNVEVSGKEGGPIEIQQTVSVDQLSMRALDALEEALVIISDGDEDEDEDEGPAN